jgi:hypothetical protein
MRLKHFDYNRLVIEAYNKKLKNNELSPLLSQSTPGNIRRECANVYQERFVRKDEQMLRAFFGPAEHGRRFLTVIQEFNVSKFKPLDQYLKGEGKKTISDRNLELLAWLIDFQYRPYSFDNDVNLIDEEKTLISRPSEIIDEPILGNEDPQNEPEEINEGIKEVGDKESGEIKMGSSVPLKVIPKNTIWNNRSKIATVIALLIFAGGIYTWQQKPDWQIMGSANTVCVYWEEDHYQETVCNGNTYGQPILSMDAEKAKRFKKITRPDTITQWSVGKLFYIKINNTIECYTEGGKYPKDLSRNLKVISQLIFDKYLRTIDSPAKDSLPTTNTTLTNNR